MISACLCQDLIEQGVFPNDVNKRARRILNVTKMSLGCYSEPQGIEIIRESVASYIEKRDGYPADKNSIFLTTGAGTSIKVIFPLLCYCSSSVISLFTFFSWN